jgi:hypothetical protein
MSANADRKKRARRITAKKREAAGNWRTFVRRVIREDVALWRAFDRLFRESPDGRFETSPRVVAYFPVR